MIVQTVARASAALGMAGLVGLAAVSGIAAHEAHGHPAKLHEGTCADLGRAVASFNGVGGTEDLEGNPVPVVEAVNPDSAYQVMLSETATDLAIDDLLASPHALMVYESDEAMTGIACGSLGGARIGDELVVALAEINVPGHVGFARFLQGPDGADVIVYVGHALSPVSAGGMGGHAAGDDDHADDHADGGDHHDDATPAAGA